MVSISGASLSRILVTGVSGFVGSALCSHLLAQGHAVRAVVRSADSVLSGAGLDVVAVGDVGAQTDWSAALVGVDCIVHCAARPHVMHEAAADALAAYRTVNVVGTHRLAEQASTLGVRRLVFLSSIKVNGESTDGLPHPFGARNDEGELDAPAPEDPYGVSKWEAEQALWAVSSQTGLDVVIVRPPLVYGPGVKGNLLRLLRWVELGVPLPLGAVQNQRSLVGLDNLVDLLGRCIDHPAAVGQTLLVSDGEDVSTPDLLRHMAAGLGRSANLLPVPKPLLRLAAYALGKQAEVDRLIGSLQIDSRYTCDLLDWTPPTSVVKGIRDMVQGS